MTLGEKIKKARLKKGIDLLQLSKKINLSYSNLWQLENDKSVNPSMKTLKIITNFLNVSMSYVLDDDIKIDDKAKRFLKSVKSLKERDKQAILLLMDHYNNWGK